MAVSNVIGGWRLVQFGDVVRQVKETTKDPASLGLDRVVGLDHLDPESLTVRRWENLAELPDGTSFTRVFRRGQLLFGKRRAYQRKAAVPDFDGICSGDILVLEPSSDDLLPEFLPYVVQSEGFFDHALGTSAGSLSPRTKFQDLAKFTFALPQLGTQRAIVEILDAAITAASRCREVGASASRTVAALLSEAIDADLEGPVLSLGEVADCAMGRVYPSSDYSTSGIRLLRPGNISASGFVEWRDDITTHLPEHYREEAELLLLAPGEVVMNLTAQSLEDGFLGRVCLTRSGDDGIVNQRIARFRSTQGSTEYLFRVLQHPAFRARVAAAAKGSKIKHLYWRDLSSFYVPVPGHEREAEVVERLAIAEGLSHRAQDHASSTTSVFKSLAHQLLRGEADVQ